MNREANISKNVVGSNLKPWLSIWVKPRKTIRYVIQNSSFKMLFILAILSGIATFLNFAYNSDLSDRLSVTAGEVLLYSFILGPILGMLFWYLLSAIYKGIGKLFGGEAMFKELQYAVAWSNVPLIFSLLLWIPQISVLGEWTFSAEVPWLSMPSLIMIIIISVIELILSIWYFVVIVKAVAEVHQFSAWKGLAVVLISTLIVFLFLFLFIFFAL